MSDTFVSITFVADELLTSTKMNQLAANQAGFHSGEALGDGIIVTRHLAAHANLQVPATNLNLGAVQDFVATSESRSTASFGDLATVGPTVSVSLGAASSLLVLWRAQFAGGPGNMAIELSGVNSYSPVQEDAIYCNGILGVFSGFKIFTGLSSGTTIVKAKYKSDSGAASFLRRWLIAIPIG